jgi:di/tricarboxylate transporter
MADMGFSAWFTLALTVLAAVLLISERVRPDLVALVVMIILGLVGFVSPKEIFSGFGGSAVITLIGISIISEALRLTGVAYWLGKLIQRMGGTIEWKITAAVMLVSAGLSLFMNNIAVVGLLLPAVMTLSRQTRTQPSRLLMPLAFGTGLGGMATLLTTSNIIVSGTLKEAGLNGFGMLDFLPIGLPVVISGTTYMLLAGRRFLPKSDREDRIPQVLSSRLADLYRLHDDIYELEVLADSALAGKEIIEGEWGAILSVTIIGIIRGNRRELAPSSNQVIEAGDRVVVQGKPSPVECSRLGLLLIKSVDEGLNISSEEVILTEVIISPHSRMIGRTLGQLRFRDRYHLNVLAVWREGKPIKKGLTCLVLRFGDTLLVQGIAAKISLLKEESDLVILQEDPDAVMKPKKQTLALVITLGTLGIATIGFLPIAVVIMLGAVMLILTNCIRMQDAYRGIEWKVIFLIAGMTPLSIAIRSSGLAEQAIHGTVSLFGQISPIGMATILVGLALTLSQFMSGQVASLVLAPLALVAANLIGIDPRGLAMAVAMGCSLTFPTPYGHPVNLMVMSPGGYTFRDFIKVGLPLAIIIIIVVLFGLQVFWGL